MTTATLKYTLHLDDFHHNYEQEVELPADGTQPPEVAELLVSLWGDGYDIDRVSLDGKPWHHYPYGAFWGPVPLRGWQHCAACGSDHPITSEC